MSRSRSARSLYRLETEKVEIDVECPASGVIHIVGETGQTYPVGDEIGYIEQPLSTLVARSRGPPTERRPRPNNPGRSGEPAWSAPRWRPSSTRRTGAIARIVLNTPEKANIQTAQQVWDFEDALTWADRDDEVKVLIVKANGKGFCAGHAIVEPEEMADGVPDHRADPGADLEVAQLRPLRLAAAATSGSSPRRRSPRSTGTAWGAAPSTAT